MLYILCFNHMLKLRSPTLNSKLTGGTSAVATTIWTFRIFFFFLHDHTTRLTNLPPHLSYLQPYSASFCSNFYLLFSPCYSSLTGAWASPVTTHSYLSFFHNNYYFFLFIFPPSHSSPAHLSQPALLSFSVTSGYPLTCPGNQEISWHQK